MNKEHVVCVYNGMEWNGMEYYSAIKKNELLPFATTCMDGP